METSRRQVPHCCISRTGINDIVVAFGPNSFFGVTFCHVAPLARLRGGMDAETEAVQIGKLRQLHSGEWYVHCRCCPKEARFQARNEDEAYGMLDEWRLSMPRRHSKFRNWSCPSCRGYWDEPEPTTTDAAGSAATDTAGSADATATSLDVLKLEVQQLKEEVVELKAKVIELKAEVHGHVVYQSDEKSAMHRSDCQPTFPSPTTTNPYCRKADGQLTGQNNFLFVTKPTKAVS